MKSGKWEWEIRLGEALQAFVRILSNTLSEKGSHPFEYRRDIIRLLKESPCGWNGEKTVWARGRIEQQWKQGYQLRDSCHNSGQK